MFSDCILRIFSGKCYNRRMTYDLPKSYLDDMKSLLGDEYDAYLSSFDEERTYGLRVNNTRISDEELLIRLGIDAERIPWISNGFYYAEDLHPGRHPYWYAGLYYLQDPSAMTPAEFLPIEENDRVLDTCAAPGGKSTRLADKLHGTGVLVANDISVSRCNALLRNLERSGYGNIYVCSEDTGKLKEHYHNYFDKILVDAPCSGEGMFRKEPSLIKDWLEKGPSYYAPIQKQIAADAVEMLKEGGMMVYSTCTFAPEEDEEVIEYLLGHYDLEVLPLTPYYEGFANGLTEKTYNCARLYPHRLKGEGHFTALLRKKGESPKEVKNGMAGKIPDVIGAFMRDFPLPYENGEIMMRQEKVYLCPYLDHTSGLRLLRSGLYLGDLKKDRFEPSQAYAMCLNGQTVEKKITLPVDDVRVMKYLHGETLQAEHEGKGTVLVTVDGYPLGFAQQSGKQLKNKLGKGWVIH